MTKLHKLFLCIAILFMLAVTLAACKTTTAPEGGPSDVYRIASNPDLYRVVDEQYGNVCYITKRGLFCLHIERGE